MAKAAYFWTMAFTITVVFYLGCAARHLLVVILRRPRDGRPLHKIAAVWGRAIIHMMPGWRVTVKGRENLPPDGKPMVFVANHESMSDIWAMYFLKVQFRWLSKEEVFKVPFIGAAMRWSYYVPIARGNRESAAQAMRQSAERLRAGISMLYFPEGTRSPDGNIKPFKVGAFKLAQEEQVPVLPIAIKGARDLLPKHSLAPGKAHVQLTVLPPLPPPPKGVDLEAYSNDVRARIVAAHAALV
jgi:1-acyl-sn-glycerol-3-phosphate acyltransferase